MGRRRREAASRGSRRAATPRRYARPASRRTSVQRASPRIAQRTVMPSAAYAPFSAASPRIAPGSRRSPEDREAVRRPPRPARARIGAAVAADADDPPCVRIESSGKEEVPQEGLGRPGRELGPAGLGIARGDREASLPVGSGRELRRAVAGRGTRSFPRRCRGRPGRARRSRVPSRLRRGTRPGTAPRGRRG